MNEQRASIEELRELRRILMSTRTQLDRTIERIGVLIEQQQTLCLATSKREVADLIAKLR